MNGQNVSFYHGDDDHGKTGDILELGINMNPPDRSEEEPAAEPGLKRAESTEVLNITLHQAARDGNVDVLRRLLEQLEGSAHKQKKLNLLDEDHLSPLHIAAKYNHITSVQLLLEKGASPHTWGEDKATALHYAARHKRQRIKLRDPSIANLNEEEKAELFTADTQSVIQLLVKQGALVNARDEYGCTPLHYAAMRGNEQAVKEFLSCANINVESTDKQKMTSLHLAAIHGHSVIVEMLLMSDANLRCKDEEDGTPLHLACMEGNINIVTMLFEAAERKNGWVTVQQMLCDQDTEGNTPLHLAIDNSHLHTAKLCIQKGADINIAKANFYTPLHLAANIGSVDIVKLLTEHNARIDALSHEQQTPLHRAAMFNNVACVDFLIKSGAQIDRRDEDGFTPLLLAVCSGHVETIQTLLKKRADIAATDNHDKTAIYWATEEEKIPALQALLEHPLAGELINETDRYNLGPLHVAAMKGFVHVIKLLIENKADITARDEEDNTPLILAAKHGRTSACKELILYDKTVIHDEDELSNTPLHQACLEGHLHVVKLLIEAGADIAARNCWLWTPLDCSAARGWTKCALALLDADSPIDPTDKQKVTPLHLACKMGHVETVELLLLWQADVTLKDAAGRNCLDVAIDSGKRDVALTLMNSEQWMRMLRNETVSSNGQRNTPMRKLIKRMPNIAEAVFNKCTTDNALHEEHFKYEITFNYEFLDDMYACWEETGTDSQSVSSIYDEDDHLKPEAVMYSEDTDLVKNNHPLILMVKMERTNLLSHPLVIALLRHKWNTYGRYVYYLNLFFYAIFVAFLTGYVCVVPNPVSADDTSNTEDVSLVVNPNSVAKSIFGEIGQFIIICLSIFNLIREIFQIIKQKTNYICWENLIEWILYILAIIFVFPVGSTIDLTRLWWQWYSGVGAIFLAWLNLIMFFRKFPRFGIYIVMFTDILNTFLQFAIVFLLFIIAFALTFYMLLNNQIQFSSIGFSMVKTAVMMVGEMEFNDIFHSGQIDSQYATGSYILFCVFLVVMPIIIMNLLVGLAVDDIKAVQESAALERMAMQVDLALEVEQTVPEFLSRKTVVAREKIWPNWKPKSWFKRQIMSDATALSAQAIARALNPERTPVEEVKVQQDVLITTVNRLKGQVKTMQLQNGRMENILVALATHHNVQWQSDDVISDR